MNYIVGYYSDKGIKKQVNQDSLIIKTAKSPYGRIGLFAICDGMGGLAQGELASATVVRRLSNWFEHEVQNVDFNVGQEEVFDMLNKLIKESNNVILEYGKVKNTKLGTTITLILTVDTKYYICQVGDSRAYKITNEIEQLTKDQTLVAREVERGIVTEEEAKVDKRKNVLLQCIGAKPYLQPDFSAGEIKENEIYIICSDGFYRRLDSDELLKELNPNLYKNQSDLENKAKELVHRVMDRREVDNISTILIKTID